MRILRYVIPYSLLILLVVNACNLPRQEKPTEDPNAALTQVAVDATAHMATQTAIALETDAPLLTETPIPTATQGPELTQTITDTTNLTPTTTEVPCDKAKFDKDVTIPDGMRVEPGEVITKVWRIRNTGSCEWNDRYDVVFEEGSSMGAPAAKGFTDGTVLPDETVDIEVVFTAPEEPGNYKSNWMLRNPEGIRFGLGDKNKAFWVEINVIGETGLMFDFNGRASSASWGSGTGSVNFANPGVNLSFGGPDTDTNGYAVLKQGVAMENGVTSGVLLATHPKMENDGYIVGKFPEYRVLAGDYIKGQIGFAKKPNGVCGSGDAEFRIYYTIGPDLSTLSSVGAWRETCDGNLRSINVDLSSLSGENIHLYLVVLARGSAADDTTIWSSMAIFR